jgi:hypothetical protein
VHPADIQDRDGGVLVLSTLFGLYPFLQKLFADGGYQGPVFQKASAKILPHLQIEIVKRSDQAKGFKLLPRRWAHENDLVVRAGSREVGILLMDQVWDCPRFHLAQGDALPADPLITLLGD